MSSKYFSTVYDIVKPIATFLHPIRVEGLENVPKEEPVLLPQPQQQLGSNSAHLRPGPGGKFADHGEKSAV